MTQLMWTGRIPVLYSFMQEELLGEAICEKDGEIAKITITLSAREAELLAEALQGKMGVYLSFGYYPERPRTADGP
jgi:hypothetical protein